jgi:hypothetical protein
LTAKQKEALDKELVAIASNQAYCKNETTLNIVLKSPDALYHSLYSYGNGRYLRSY